MNICIYSRAAGFFQANNFWIHRKALRDGELGHKIIRSDWGRFEVGAGKSRRVDARREIALLGKPAVAPGGSRIPPRSTGKAKCILVFTIWTVLPCRTPKETEKLVLCPQISRFQIYRFKIYKWRAFEFYSKGDRTMDWMFVCILIMILCHLIYRNSTPKKTNSQRDNSHTLEDNSTHNADELREIKSGCPGPTTCDNPRDEESNPATRE
jgi:hypothetical protein